MILRPRQDQFVQRVCAALEEHGRTLGVAPTGAGKTVMLSAVASRYRTVLVLQHRDELVRQNAATMRRYAPDTPIGRWDAKIKDWADRGVTYAMVQTLCRPASLEAMRPVDLVVVDEGHHATAASWAAIVDRARELNPSVRLLGVTATPNRGDGRGLGAVYGHCADQITLGELIRSGHLVPPIAYVIEHEGSEELARVRTTSSGEYDMTEAAAALDVEAITAEVVRHWREKAGDRTTAVFCATVAHAEHVLTAYRAEGVRAEIVTGETPGDERAATFRALDEGRVQVLLNVAVATEGWDCPRCSCIVLLRPASYQSTMIQMIGRGLRVIDPARYPGLVKTDCVVLDFGRSLLTHGGIEQVLDLDGAVREGGEVGEGARKRCPECAGDVPAGCRVCPLCGHVFPAEASQCTIPETLEMRIIDILSTSPYRWIETEPGRCRVAGGLGVTAIVAQVSGVWGAVGYTETETATINPRTGKPRRTRRAVPLAVGDEGQCLAAADDYLRAHGNARSCGTARRWLDLPPTPAQVAQLARSSVHGGRSRSRYEASCRLTLLYARQVIGSALTSLTADGRPDNATGAQSAASHS